ncbi:SDR family oxidoreductase [Dongia sp.]|uniref:SDR family oxidoreductase n=1 Tax=Dongia sp. TaxID=1977262 RepID=UPI0035ADDB56
MKKKCVVTGGAGFIGSHLTERLLADGHEVVVVDNLHTGRLSNLQDLKGEQRLSFLEAGVEDFARMRTVMQGAQWVFHLAARADIVPSIQQPIEYHQANVQGTISVLEAARAAEVERFVYAASSSCYGVPDAYPTPETTPARPQYPYALTKYIGEQYVMHWQQVYGLPALSLRFFNVFGPRHRTTGAYGAAFGVFLAQKLAGQPYTIVGDGNQTRDFTYVTDIADALVTAAASDKAGQIYNVGSGGTYSVNSLIDLLGGERVYIPRRPGEPDCTFADISKIARELGWQPTVKFADGVRKMLEHIEDWRDAPVWTADKIREATHDWFRYLGRNS